MNPDSETPNSQCSQCGANLHCGAVAGENECWCFASPHKLPVPKEDETRGCLCNNCLDEAIAKLVAGSK
jgi:hypothetical protein